MRTCACGCGASLAGRRPEARFASDACRAAHWKATTHYDRNKPRNGRNGTDRPGGFQVAYGRMVNQLVTTLSLSERAARRIVNGALSERQQERVEGRQ